MSNPAKLLRIRGGDGRLFHTINAPDYRGEAIELTPSGRGNALARDLARRPDRGEFVLIDLIETVIHPAVGAPYARRCASSVAFGYPADLTRKAEKLRWLGRLSYAAAGLATFPRGSMIEVAYDGAAAERKRLTGILVNNTRHAGGFTAIREAQTGDGLIDVLELSAGYVSQTVHNLSEVTGLGAWRPARHAQFRKASIGVERPSLLMLDGELIERVTFVELVALPSALKIRTACRRRW